MHSSVVESKEAKHAEFKEEERPQACTLARITPRHNSHEARLQCQKDTDHCFIARLLTQLPTDVADIAGSHCMTFQTWIAGQTCG